MCKLIHDIVDNFDNLWYTGIISKLFVDHEVVEKEGFQWTMLLKQIKV
jgi:hypothetical protein